ncbi:uncharacterized protein AMSG_02389 [Thecamonas trahens ATCC 50062]|uniref:PX domain-containing protein n=1 Tax=Thecamonas trahens ATCC 50062 TaxID=461836 RepID=A0A0L0DY03_THETB|nr:hypothetical protein AMSG_02389 [Thecamonas trahens ATCC 50062]KNC56418.1 hypothetical protein AMSG_02389 [Thecamonas trahens ATCC 50062]|eukprot:XP_013760931.1 hypothetical protein AMSG_02389 [Thecamonas trahens ATCC 50062]
MGHGFAADALFHARLPVPGPPPPRLANELYPTDDDKERMEAWNRELALSRDRDRVSLRRARRQQNYDTFVADGGMGAYRAAVAREERRRRRAAERERRRAAELEYEKSFERVRFRMAKRGGRRASYEVQSLGRVTSSPVDSFAGLMVTLDDVVRSDAGGVWYVLALSYGVAPAWTIHRTYEDFAALAETLRELYPQLEHVAFPPSYSYGESWDSVVAERKTGLLTFLVQTLALPKTPVLDSFLEFSFHVMDFVCLRYERLYNSVAKVRRKIVQVPVDEPAPGEPLYEEYEEIYEVDVEDLATLDDVAVHQANSSAVGSKPSRTAAVATNSVAVQTAAIQFDTIFNFHLEQMREQLADSLITLMDDTHIYTNNYVTQLRREIHHHRNQQRIHAARTPPAGPSDRQPHPQQAHAAHPHPPQTQPHEPHVPARGSSRHAVLSDQARHGARPGLAHGHGDGDGHGHIKT